MGGTSLTDDGYPEVTMGRGPSKNVGVGGRLLWPRTDHKIFCSFLIAGDILIVHGFKKALPEILLI